MKKAIIILLSILFVLLFAVSAQAEKRIYTAKSINPEPPVIDGRLDDPVWQEAEYQGDFIQREPYEGKEASQRTAFKILYDEKNIYVAIRVYDSEPEKIVRRMARRDILDGDWVRVEIDSYFDHRSAFSFGVNAAGVKCDEFVSGDGENSDSNWDPIWHVETGIDGESWTAEMRIPLSQLRFGKKENSIWGLQVTRHLFRKRENSHWQFIPKDAAGWVHAFGELHGLEDIKSARQVELYPYAVGRVERFAAEPGNPFATGKASRLMSGLDGKFGVSSDLTLDFTINPDFGQVEADPSVVNLTAFETYYVEKRPFFIEGRNILSFRIMLGDGDFSSDTLFYSRRIGRQPGHFPQTGEDEYADMPQNTSIIGAFKLTGKTKNGLSIGLIEGITAEEKATISFQGQSREEAVEPLTNYFGLRLQKDYREGDTLVGAMVTATNRNIQTTELEFLHDSAYSGGVDFYHRWKERTYFVQANAVFSLVQGSPGALLRTQMSPLRYYQRPDASHVFLDPLRTSLFGHGGSLILGKMGSGHFQFSGGVTWRSPGLELNDMGYLRSADKIMEFVWAGYRIWQPFSIFRRLNIGFNQWKGWDFSGTNIFDGGNVYFNAQLKNYWTFSVGFNRNGESLSTSVLRGGPSMRWDGRWNIWNFLETDSRKKLRFHLSWNMSSSDRSDSFFKNYSFGLISNPTSALSLSIQPSYSLNRQELQYVCQRSRDEENRYVFASIEQKTFAASLRLNLSLTPDLSIQFYGQPFISAGSYSDFKHIHNPRAEEYRDRFLLYPEQVLSYDPVEEKYAVDENKDGSVDYHFGNPNFSFLQFRSNLVIRWEYKPGSTVYLVWSQGRTDILPNGDFSFGNDMENLFALPPHNVFLIKFSYGFTL